MKVIKKSIKEGNLVFVDMSYSDVVENGLVNTFSMNKHHRYELIKKGQFMNFINNYLISEAYDKGDDGIYPGHRPMTYQIFSNFQDSAPGADSPFIRVQVVCPKLAITKAKDTLPKDFDNSVFSKDHFSKADEGWTPSNEERIKK